MKRALFYLITTIFYIQHAYANTEKLILQVDSQNLNLCDPQFETLTKAQTALSLKPPFSEIQNSLIPQNDFQWYNLDDLKDNSNYEIRVSYPAITPADFQLKIVNSCKRLDDSLSFTLQVSAIYTGVSQIENMKTQPVTFNLVLENLYFGFLFYQVYKIVIAITVVLFIGYFLWMPFIKKLVIKRSKTE